MSSAMFVLRLILSFLIVLCGSVVGLYFSSRLNRREELLHSFETMLYTALSRISYGGSSLSEAFADNFAGFIFHNNRPFSSQWQELVNSFFDVLSQNDKAVLLKIADEIGTGDTDSQLNLLHLFIKEIEDLRAFAHSDKEKKGKLYRSLPAALSVVIAILLI